MLEKTRRGVYLNLDNTPYTFMGYKFSSKKKMEMFIKKVGERQVQLNQVYGRIYKISGAGKDYDLSKLTADIMEKVYKEMQYK